MDLLIRSVGLVGAHQRIVVMLALAALLVVVVATATSAVLLSLPHGILFS
jgi:hypothetical protein